MTDPLTNEQLIELVAHKTPEELTPEEIDLLRSRLAESPELREVLIGQLQMETYLATALGRVNITPQQIVARAQQQSPAGSGGVLLVLALLVALPLLVLAAAVLRHALRDGGDEQQIATTGQAPSTEQPTNPIDPAGKQPADLPSGTDSAPTGNPATDDAGHAPPMPPPGDKPPMPLPALPPAAPWQAALDQAGDPPPYEQVAFEPLDTSKSMPQRDDLRAWFEKAPEGNVQFHRVDTRRGPCGAIEGVARLRSPWPENSALRMGLENYNHLLIHCYHGEQGVTLAYYQDHSYRWAAYTTTREPGKVWPKTWAIAGTDDDRARRAEVRQGGPLELRYHTGELLLSRGDILLVSAPLAGPPDDVYFDGKAVFEGLALVRTQGVPALPPSNPVTLEVDRPADLDWQTTRPELAGVEKLPDGSVRLTADKVKEPVAVFAALPREGLREVVLQLDEITAGSGVMLCNAAGQNHYIVRFHHDRRSGQLHALLRSADQNWERDLEQPKDHPVGIMLPKTWVKLTAGCGTLRWWLSTDGVHWAQPELAVDNAPPELTHIGLFANPNAPGASVTLRSIQLRDLAGLTALAPPELVDQAPALPKLPAVGPWLAETLARQPADVDARDWLRASALRTLGAGAGRELGNQLLEALLDDMAARDLTLDQKTAAVSDAMLLCLDLRDGGAMRVGLLRRFWELGLAEADARQALAWSSVRRRLQSVPLVSHLQNPLELERPIRTELIQRAYAHEPRQTLQFVQSLRLFDQQRYSPLVDWAEALAARDLPAGGARTEGTAVARFKEGWREPLIEDLSKEAYNAMTELQAVLESEAWPEAARLITSADGEAAPGISPYLADRRLMVSLPVAVRLVLGDYPQVREALGDQFGPLARLRIGQAIAAADAATIEMATVQFAGTDAAGQAHQWLGDRALASGWFERAIAEYRTATAALPSLKSQVEPRIRLAAAMLGRDEGEPVTATVQFNELSMSAAEFEALVAEMKARGNVATLSQPESVDSRAAAAAAKRYEAHVRSRLDGPTGERPQEEVGERRTNQFRVPWADRQVAAHAVGDVMYASNHFQVAAYNLTSGQRLWQSQPPPGPMQRSQDWALIAMRPLVTADRLYVRMLYSANPLLVCLERSSGKLLWAVEAPPREFFVSDPVIVQGQLAAVSVSVQLEQQGVLRWNVLDPETGELQCQRDLVRLRNTWGKRACCELVALDDSVVASLGGVTLAIDPAGKLRWVRKHVTIPTEEDPRWVLQRYDRPLVVGERMYVAQPGVRTVDCLDPATGREFWSAVLPEVVGLIGASDDRLIVRTEREILALDCLTGKTLWRYDAPELHSFQLADDHVVLLAARERKPDNNDRWLTRLVWLDASTGQPTATCVLPGLEDADPRLGPLVPYKDRLFTFFGHGQHDPTRDVVELVPTGDAEQPVPVAVLNDPWLQRIPLRLTTAAFQVLPDWQLLSGGEERQRTGLVSEIHGEKDALGVRSLGAAGPIVLGRQIAIPAMGRPRLRLRLGTDGGQTWKLEARHGQQVLKAEEIKDQTHPDRWKTLEIDLTPAASQTGWLTIRLQSAGGDHVLWLKSAEVVF